MSLGGCISWVSLEPNQKHNTPAPLPSDSRRSRTAQERRRAERMASSHGVTRETAGNFPPVIGFLSGVHHKYLVT